MNQKEKIGQIQISNAKVIKCIKNIFKENSIVSNANFWIFLIIIIFQIAFLFNACCKGKQQIYKRLYSNIEQNEINHNPPKRSGSAESSNSTTQKRLKLGKIILPKIDKEKRNSNKYDDSLISKYSIKKKFENFSNNEVRENVNEVKKSKKKYSEPFISFYTNNNNLQIDKINNNESFLDSESKRNLEKILKNENNKNENNLIENKSSSKVNSSNSNINIEENNSNANPRFYDNSNKESNNNFSLEIQNNNSILKNNISNNINYNLIKSGNKSHKNNNKGKEENEAASNDSGENDTMRQLNGINPNNDIKPLNLKNPINTKDGNLEFLKQLSNKKNQNPQTIDIEISEKESNIDKIKIEDEIKVNILEDKNKKLNKINKFSIIENKPLNIENNFLSCFFKYFRKREILFIAFLNHNNKTPKFIRGSIFMLSLSIIFLINCFFFDESLVHKRYLNALSGKINNISYFFKKEFQISVYTALISNIIKMIFIKIIINWIFKITKKDKIIMKRSFEEGLSQEDLNDLQFKRVKYSKDYLRNIKIYFILLFAINIFVAYICICYGEIFTNSYIFFILSFFASYIMSFIFCMLLCFLIIIIYKIWSKTNYLMVITIYIILNKIY